MGCNTPHFVTKFTTLVHVYAKIQRLRTKYSILLTLNARSDPCKLSLQSGMIWLVEEKRTGRLSLYAQSPIVYARTGMCSDQCR